MSNENVTVTFQIPKELHERLVNHAKLTSRSLAGLCRWAAIKYLATDEARGEVDNGQQ
jgi:predicted DNA-binding protein